MANRAGNERQKTALGGRTKSPLRSGKLVAFVATRNPNHAKAFYRDTLGLPLVSEDEFALVFNASGTILRVTAVQEVVVASYTVLGWKVVDIVHTAKNLQKAGVVLQRYAGMVQDEIGIWKSPGGAQVAWFKDPDGNTLSITES